MHGTRLHTLFKSISSLFISTNPIYLTDLPALLLVNNSKRFFSYKYSINKSHRFFVDFFKLSFMNFSNIYYFILILKWLITTVFWIKARVSYYTNNWIYTTNHKRIAVNYFWFVILSGIVGMVLATIIRLEFAYPGVGVLAGDSIQYLSLASAHGVIMVFFMIMPLLFGAFANFLLPTQLGVHDVAFPRLNSAAFWFLPGGLLMLCQLVCVDRRYQRMNCFNIREVESLLKRRFFTDLINSKDHHTLIDKTAIGLRYKVNDTSYLNNNINLFYNYGLENSAQSRTTNYVNLSFLKTIKNFDDIQTFSLNSYIFKLVSYFNTINVFFLLNSIFFFFLDKTSLTASFVTFSSLFDSLIFFIAKVTRLGESLYFFFSFIASIIGNFCSFIKSLIKGFISTFYEVFVFTLATFKDAVVNTFNFLVRPFIYFYTFFSELQITLLFQNLKKKIFSFSSEFRFFADSNPLYYYSRLFLNSSVLFFKKLIDETSVNFTTYRFNVNYDFNRNFFVLNIYNIIKISMNNWLACFSWSNNIFRLLSIFQKNPTYPTYFFNESNPIAYKNIWDKSFQQTYLSSFMVEFYSFLYFILNFPLLVINLFLYFLTQHFLFFNLEKVKVDFFFWQLNTLNGTNVWKNTVTLEDKKFLKETYSRLYVFNELVERYFTFFMYVDQTILPKIFYAYNFVISAIYRVRVDFHNFCDAVDSFIFAYFWGVFKIVTEGELKTNFNQVQDALILFFKFIYNSKMTKIILNKKIFTHYASTEFIDITSADNFLFNNEELSNNTRFVRFNNPVFKYDYKSGDYFPKLYKDLYFFLIPSIVDLTSGLRTPSWFFSTVLNELLETNLTVVLNNLEKKINFSKFTLSPTKLNKVSHSDAFYNFFYTLTNENTDLNLKWISTNSLNTKFNRMFLTSSLQQRIYGNWRNLKFTREAWRCKMLLTRHQKTLFRRYMHEDGVFWSIERNAKDLIPGWAMITPFSSRTRYTAVGKTDIGLMGVLLVLNSSIISGANFLVTYRYLSTLNNRKMRDARAFFTEAVMVASWMMILANPMLVIGIVMLISDRHWQTSFFDYSGGGDTVLFQHMFWFFGHPEVYVIIIPTFGFTNTMMSYYLKKRVSARASLLYSLYTIAFLGFFVWGHHMYMVGLSHTTRMLFSTLTVMISVPAATKIMHWCVTTANSAFAMELPLLFTFTFIFFFVSGGISGMCVAHTGMDVLFHDTFYVIGHFHVMLAGGAMFASFGAFYFYFPAIFGVKYSRIYAYLHYTYYLIGQLMTVIPMLWLGYAGMPRRVLDYPTAFGGWHSVISAGHMLNVAGLIAFFIMIFDSLRQAKAATRNTFGISRYNTRLNFYIYEIARLTYLQQKALFLFKYYRPVHLKLNNFNYFNFEPYESVLFSYVLLKK